jgi:hypothetical protein
MIKDEGGSAFPQHPIYSLQEEDGVYDLLVYEQGSGMTLRDYFAAKAMLGLFSSGHFKGSVFSQNTVEVAKVAYIMANAMLAAREQE